jgi:tetratricopeptide (TPR) repeat protein
MLSVLYHLDFWMLFEESINLRNAFTIIQGLKSFMDSVESELRSGKNIDRYQIDEHLVSGVTLSYSLYNIIISFMPDIIVRMLQFIGFPSDRDWGMGMLAACGDWDPMAPPETPREHAERLASSANDGIRRQFCDMVPIIFQVVVGSFIPLNHIDLSYAQMINDYNLELYPNSPFFLFLKGRHLQVTSKLDEAVEVYKSVKIQAHWHHLNHIFAFEEMMIGLMKADLDVACERSRQLLKESRWSKCCFRYLTAITGYERGDASEKRKIENLMGKVEAGMQKVAGMNLFFETFCARKSKRFINEGRLLLPCYDFMLLWNAFDMMPPHLLEKALATISSEVRRLEAMLPQKMKERESQPLAAKDQTIEASSGGYLSSMFSNKNAILKDSKVEGYENFYDDYCLAFFLQGLVAYHIAFFPEAAFNGEMCRLAHESFQTVFRYAPLIKDDTYTYYFSHYYKAKIWIHQGRYEEAQARFKYIVGLTNTNLTGLPGLVGGKGKNSLELFVLMRVHSGLLDIETAKAAAGEGSINGSAESIKSSK